MTYTSLAPNLMVEDVEKTIAFYRDTLGFEVTARVPEEGTPVWASVTADTVSLMFQQRHSLGEELPQLVDQPIGGTLTLYIGVDDADALYTRVRDKAHIIKEPMTTFYNAREFYLQDPNGYILGFSSPVAGGDLEKAQ
ncbi:MAG TPA: VOC family protein [Ktedonobacterales bacterium]|nr:VOC family protein [Ktedonobacterales bacterium]